MEKRGQGAVPGRVRSNDRVIALNALVDLFEHAEFPATKEDLLACCGDARIAIGTAGTKIPVRDLLDGVHVEVFSSAKHVREVVSLDWEDWASVHRGDYGGG